MKLGSKDTNTYLHNNGSAMGIPKSLQRVLPACFALFMIFWFLSSNSDQVNEVSQRVFAHRNTLFPRKVWQTWKVDPLDFEQRDLDTARSWPAKNPSYRYEVLTDQNDLAWVETHFGPEGFNRLDIVYIYRELTLRIIKADLLRYLVMYVEGGLYTDIDVEALRPITDFVPERFDERDVDMVVGVEIDQPEFAQHPILGQKCQSFCQWTFMCKPHLPVMMELVESIMLWLKGIAAEQNKPISEIELDFDQVIAGTGPSAFTKAILAHMSERAGKTITWSMFHGIGESKLVGGVLVLTVEAFAAGQGHSDSGTHDTKHALVRHHYHASKWPDKHPRYKHPVYAEVELCNWVQDCVDRWDENTANFAKMTPEEQQGLIDTHNKEEAERIEREQKEEAEKKEREEKEEKEKKEREDREAKENWDKAHPPAAPEGGAPPASGDAPPAAPGPEMAAAAVMPAWP
ncbi:hypothetical protein B0A48_11935 [Cryoendolithus antarcticus]|uniref:Initiation-specific alpha-1,6-mannosyltransferase n=1 Tax=Cryoendolithus antarcticus TaxID=1507870 RepID=A0A1V8STP0_9PEZI|nr:hypothetical protein B0A48_11935 [Cryoendolithus antarcticus]OQO08727.1 hypothetical protein B0A51_17908 [Rachicladosporium sp. CCFEE 5018]